MIILEEDYTNYPYISINPNLWSYVISGSGFGNNEQQYYTDRLSNLYFDNEGMHIVGIKEEYESRSYTSARITSKISFKYGRISFRAKLPKLNGSWPAVWLLGEEIKSLHNWPECGEIDILEYAKRFGDVIHTSLHSKTYNHKLNNHRTKLIDIDPNVFHDYTYIWDKNGFTLIIDDITYELFKKGSVEDNGSWPFDKPYFLIMNMAVGGYFAGEIDKDYQTDEFIIKYLKVESIED